MSRPLPSSTASEGPPDLTDRPTVYGARAKLGVIVPPTNTANEAEWQALAPDGVTVHSARMPLHTDTASEAGRKALFEDIARHARDLAQASVDVVVYGCTAGSMVTPVTDLSEFMAAETGCRAISTAQAIVAALGALDVKRVSVATPYHDALNGHEAAFLEAHALTVVAIEGLGYGAGGPHEFRSIARVTPDEVEALARRVVGPETEALLLSCTDLATLAAILRLEAALGIPVISSNSATLWLALRTAGVADRIPGAGKLFEAG